MATSQKRIGGSKLTGLVLVVPGIVLYVYLLYIIFTTLVYPGSFAPFMTKKPVDPGTACAV